MPSLKTVKNRRGLMAWLVIAADGTSRFIRCPDRMDSLGYQTQILTPSLGFIKAAPRTTGTSVYFQQDRASCHTSRSTTAYLWHKNVNVLPNWPAISPDINIVEHCWAWLARQMIGKSFSSIDDLWADLKSAWKNDPPTLIPNLYGSIICRLTAVQVAKGGNTKY